MLDVRTGNGLKTSGWNSRLRSSLPEAQYRVLQYSYNNLPDWHIFHFHQRSFVGPQLVQPFDRPLVGRTADQSHESQNAK